jgi:hypothetical protein
MVENMVAFSYTEDSTSVAQALQLLDVLLTRSREVILANMRQLTSLTLGILKSLYPRANLDTTGEGFTMTFIEEVSKLIEDSAVIASQVMEMLLVGMLLKYG